MASSSPRSPATMTEKSASTPPSSPPSAGLSPANLVEDGDAGLGSALSETMRAEEKAMLDASRRHEEARDRELEKERQSDLQGGSSAVDTKFKALEYLLSQSKVCRYRFLVSSCKNSTRRPKRCIRSLWLCTFVAWERRHRFRRASFEPDIRIEAGD